MVFFLIEMLMIAVFQSSANYTRCTWASRVIPIVLGLILLGAAILKTYQLATEPILEKGILSSRLVQVIVVEFQLGLAFWLMSGIQSRRAHLVGIITFAMFAIYNLLLLVEGQRSCGCFGNLEVSPWFTLGLDVVAVIALYGSLLTMRLGPVSRELGPPMRSDTGGQEETPDAPLSSYSQARGGAVWFLLFLVAALTSGYATFAFRNTGLEEDDQLLKAGRTVLLEPEKWQTGKPFPLFRWIDNSEPLRTGSWVVILFKHDCLHCQQEIPQLIEEFDSRGARVALLELPPHGPFPLSRLPLMLKLKDEIDWFCQVPVICELANGNVVRVRRDPEIAHH